MNFNRKTPFYRACPMLVALLIATASAHAQTTREQSAARSNAEAEQNEANPAESAAAVKLLNSKIDRLQLLIEQQQRALTEMQKRLDGLEGRATPSSKNDGNDVTSADLRTASIRTTPATIASQSPSPDKPEAAVAGWGKDHAFLRSADGAFETHIGGYGQLDFRGYGSGNHPANTFLLRRARIALEGKLDRYFDFRIEGDFADPVTPLRDLYVNVHRIDEFQVRFGQFRVPISQEEMRSDNLQDFVERSLVNNLVPSRSPGIGASGVIDSGVFEYQVGAWNGKGLLTANNNGTPETAIRLRFNPWKHGHEFLAKGLIFGGAVTQGRSLGGTSVRGLTESRSVTFFVPDAINGKYTRANGEMTWMLGPASIRAEYDQTNQRRDNLGPGGRNLPGVVAKGYMAQMTYVLTGEEKPEVGVVAPRRNLFGDGNGKEGFGAWELKFRYANLQIDDSTAKSNRAETLFFGTNWYMNRFVRYMLDVGFERFKDPVRTPKPGDNNFFVVLSRVQVAF
ncbi:MAG TPA: porin [Blastocatellia bacterium]|nr:porin [Blastocatellia bacterium]